MEGLQVVVADVDAARAQLAGRGVEVSEVQEFPWGRFVFFSDPDGNGWAVQEIQRARLGPRYRSRSSSSPRPEAARVVSAAQTTTHAVRTHR